MPNACEITRLIFNTVDIATAEFSLALRHSAVAAAAKLWPQNGKLIIDFNARGDRYDRNRGKPPRGRKRARRVTFITSGMVMLMEKARKNRCWVAKARISMR
jgi:hypothetical protein